MNHDQLRSDKQKSLEGTTIQPSTRLLQLNVVNLEQTILKELEQNPTLEQLDPAEEESLDLEKDKFCKDTNGKIFKT